MATFRKGLHGRLSVIREHVEHAKILDEIARETGGDVAEERQKARARWTYTPVDAEGLRGIPAVGPGWGGGAIRGTRPGDCLR